MLKLIGTAYWLAVLINFFVPFPGSFYEVTLYSGLVILGLHVLELILLNKYIRQVTNNYPKEAIMILLFGVIHLQELRKPQAN